MEGRWKKIDRGETRNGEKRYRDIIYPLTNPIHIKFTLNLPERYDVRSEQEAENRGIWLCGLAQIELSPGSRRQNQKDS